MSNGNRGTRKQRCRNRSRYRNTDPPSHRRRRHAHRSADVDGNLHACACRRHAHGFRFHRSSVSVRGSCGGDRAAAPRLCRGDGRRFRVARSASSIVVANPSSRGVAGFSSAAPTGIRAVRSRAARRRSLRRRRGCSARASIGCPSGFARRPEPRGPGVAAAAPTRCPGFPRARAMRATVDNPDHEGGRKPSLVRRTPAACGCPRGPADCRGRAAGESWAPRGGREDAARSGGGIRSPGRSQTRGRRRAQARPSSFGSRTGGGGEGCLYRRARSPSARPGHRAGSRSDGVRRPCADRPRTIERCRTELPFSVFCGVGAWPSRNGIISGARTRSHSVVAAAPRGRTIDIGIGLTRWRRRTMREVLVPCRTASNRRRCRRGCLAARRASPAGGIGPVSRHRVGRSRVRGRCAGEAGRRRRVTRPCVQRAGCRSGRTPPPSGHQTPAHAYRRTSQSRTVRAGARRRASSGRSSTRRGTAAAEIAHRLGVERAQQTSLGARGIGRIST